MKTNKTAVTLLCLVAATGPGIIEPAETEPLNMPRITISAIRRAGTAGTNIGYVNRQAGPVYLRTVNSTSLLVGGPSASDNTGFVDFGPIVVPNGELAGGTLTFTVVSASFEAPATDVGYLIWAWGGAIGPVEQASDFQIVATAEDSNRLLPVQGSGSWSNQRVTVPLDGAILNVIRHQVSIGQNTVFCMRTGTAESVPYPGASYVLNQNEGITLTLEFVSGKFP